MKRLVSILDGWGWRGNIYVAFFLHFILVMLLFSLCRIGFYWFNASFFTGMTMDYFLRLMAGGLRFDLAAVLYTNMLFILMIFLPFRFRFDKNYLRVTSWIFFITNGIALAANVADFIYYRFTLRRTTADVFLQFKNEKNLSGLFFHFLLDYWYALIFWLGLMFLLIILSKRIYITGPLLKSKVAFYSSGVVAFIIMAGLVVAGIRGGFRESTRPITLSNAGEYVKDPREISIVLNTPFAIYRTLDKTKIQAVNYFSTEELERIYSPVHHRLDSSSFRKDNVVIIILESFSKEFFGAFNGDVTYGKNEGYTPFLDSLIQYSKTYEFSFANGRKSIDGLPSVVSSIPSVGLPYFLSPYSGNRINSLASLLKEKGYHSSFFHGAPNGSMGFQAFMNIAGFDQYFGMTEYGNEEDSDGLWGIWDRKFFNYYADQLSSFQQPFVSTIFSVSSHHPFKVPEEDESKYKEGQLVIHKCIEYTDHSLKEFFSKVSKMPWYENTLFVITADHTSSEIQFPEHRTAWGVFSIPIIFFKPDHSLLGREPEIIQQIDIMPTVLGYLGYDKDYVAFGRDVWNEKTEPFAFNYHSVHQLFLGDYILQFDGSKSLGLYNFKKDNLMTTNLVNESPEIVMTMERRLKAILQQYNNRLVDNRLTVSKTQSVISIQ